MHPNRADGTARPDKIERHTQSCLGPHKLEYNVDTAALGQVMDARVELLTLCLIVERLRAKRGRVLEARGNGVDGEEMRGLVN